MGEVLNVDLVIPFKVAPQDSEPLDNDPVWARLFTQAVGSDPAPTWAGPLAEFVGE